MFFPFVCGDTREGERSCQCICCRGREDRKGGRNNAVVLSVGSGWGGKLEQVCSLEVFSCQGWQGAAG